MNEQLLADLERDEGYDPEPYKDTLGIWSIAIGRNLEANPLTGQEWKQLLDAGEITISINHAGALRLLVAGVQDAQVTCAITFRWWSSLDLIRRDVIANLCFNLGMTRLLGFRLMFEAMQARDYERAADELEDSRWFKQVGRRGPRLVKQLRQGRIS